jgi:hypothetical protein
MRILQLAARGRPAALLLTVALAAVSILGCGGLSKEGERTALPDLSRRISLGLASVLPPGGSGWSLKRAPARITFGKLGTVPSQSFSGMVVLARLPVLNSKEEFLDWNVRERARDSGDPRYKDLVTNDTVAIEDGVWAFRFHTKYEDSGATNLPAGTHHLVVEDIGAVFRHPFESGVAVYVALSQRSTPQGSDETFERVAREFLGSVEFHSDSSK